MSANTKQIPNIGVEVFLSLCKWFLIIIVVINLIWAWIFRGYYRSTFDTSTHKIEMTQDGYQNNQELTNGTTND